MGTDPGGEGLGGGEPVFPTLSPHLAYVVGWEGTLQLAATAPRLLPHSHEALFPPLTGEGLSDPWGVHLVGGRQGLPTGWVL